MVPSAFYGKGVLYERIRNHGTAYRYAVAGAKGGNQDRSGQDAGKGEADQTAVR